MATYRYSGADFDPAQRFGTAARGGGLVPASDLAGAGGAPSPSGGRAAGGLGFLNALNFLRGPRGVIGGTLLAGVPIAMSAIDQLNADPTNPTGNLSGAAGATALGVAGQVGGAALGGVLTRGHPLGALAGGAIGSWLGSSIGGSAGRGAADALSGMSGDPALRAERARAEMLMEMQEKALREGLPTRLAYDRANNLSLREQAAIVADADARRAYSQALYAAAMGRPGNYADPGFMPSLASVANRSFG